MMLLAFFPSFFFGWKNSSEPKEPRFRGEPQSSSPKSYTAQKIEEIWSGLKDPKTNCFAAHWQAMWASRLQTLGTQQKEIVSKVLQRFKILET